MMMMRRLNRFHKDQGGSAITEFVMTLPVWIFTMYMIWDMGLVQIHTTNTSVVAQTNLWSKAIPLTKNLSNPVAIPSDQLPHAIPLTGANTALQAEGNSWRNAHNGRDGFNKIEGKAHAAAIGGLGGDVASFSVGLGDSHYVESAYRGGNLSVGMSNVPDFKIKAEDVIGGNAVKYPLLMLDDGIDLNSDIKGKQGSSLLASIAFALIDLSGGIHGVTAGARYGAVSGENTGEYKGIGGWTVKPGFRYDTLVSPIPMVGDEANWFPASIARLGAETETNYAVALRFCKGDWSGETPAGEQPDLEGRADEERNKACSEAGYSSSETALCEQCAEQGQCSSTNCKGYDKCTCDPASCQPPPPPTP